MATHEESRGSSNRKQYRRRMRLVNPGFQWKYTVLLVSGAFLVYTLMSVVLFGVLHQQARARILNPIPTNVWENTYVIVIAAAAFAVVLALTVGAWSFVMTHRICGPLFVMERYLGEMAAGRFPKRRPLRKKDEFKEFYDEFWRAVDAVKARERSNLQALNRLLNTVQLAAQADDEERLGGLEHLGNQIEALRTDIAAALEEPLAPPTTSSKSDRGVRPPCRTELGAPAKPTAEQAETPA